jgi:hypothetical protein
MTGVPLVFATGPLAYVDLTWPLSNYYNFDIDMKVTTVPGQDSGTFWSFQFGFVGAGGGYMGLQIIGSKHKVIFSIWGAINGNPNNNGDTSPPETFNGCRTVFDNGNAWQCLIDYNWQVGKNYRMRLWITTKESSGDQWWVGAISDYSTNNETTIGSILVPPNYGLLANWASTWVENFGYSTCDVPQTEAIFSYPYARNAASGHGPQAAKVTYGKDCSDSNVQYLGNGAYALETGKGVQRSTADQTMLWSQEPTLVRQPASGTTTQPSIAVTSAVVQQGQSITISGSGFTPNGPVTVVVKPNSSSATADSSGNLYATFYIGTDFPTGETDVWAYDASAGVDSNHVVITITAPATSTTSSSSTTSGASSGFIIDPEAVGAITIVALLVIVVVFGFQRFRGRPRRAREIAPSVRPRAEKSCGNCRTMLPLDAKFCDSCGAKQN